MNDGLWSGSGVRRSAFAAAVLTLGGLGAVGLHRGLAEARDTHAVRAATTPHISDAALATRTSALADLENGFTAIADRLEPSVVSIRVEKRMQVADNQLPDQFFRQFTFPNFGDNGDGPQPPRGQQPRIFATPRRAPVMMGAGSGVIVRPDGWILTNDHVVGGADKVTVTLHDGRKFTGVVRRDFRSDLAVVKIPASGLEPAEFANSDDVQPGQWAIAFGSPFELDDTMTLGIISARQRQKEISEDGQTRFYPSLIQTDAAINPGNSGGPLVDVRGRVMGIDVAINSPSGGSVGIGFAIPSNTARNVMDQLISKGTVTRGFLGVMPAALTPDQRSTYDVRQGGALVESVTDGSPAAEAGLQVEDVIVRFNGQPVRDDVSLRDLVARTAPGTRVDMVVVRGGHEVTVTPTLKAAVALPEEKGDATPPAPAPKPQNTGRLGVTVQPATADLAKQYKLDANVHGVIVTDVASGSPAANAGIEPGMAILRVNGHDVSSADQLRTQIESVPAGTAVRMVVQVVGQDGANSRTLVTVTMQ